MIFDEKKKKQVKKAAPVRQARRVFQAFREFDRLEASGGIVLMIAAVIALVWANSPWADLYFELWHIPLVLQVGENALLHDLHWWINEGLMVIFFFVVGLEIKREILVGELSSIRNAALPIAGAIGGMLFPAAIYAFINQGTPGIGGWGIPMATDIAFALGVMALLGTRAPLTLKVFLTALAIVDDIGAVLVIAIFYTGDISWIYLAAAGGILAILMLANFFGVRSPIFYSLLGLTLWLAFLQSGLHTTIAGILLALTIPASGKIRSEDFLSRARAYLHEFEHGGESDKRPLNEHQQGALQSLENAVEAVETPLQRLEHALHPWVTYLVIPVFALANAGVAISSDIGAAVTDRVSLGVILGLIVGKQLGVTLAAWIAVKTKVAGLPKGVTLRHIYGAGWLAGIGFTMSLFISGLAFTDTDNQEAAKIGILIASLIAGVVGYLILRTTPTESTPKEA